MRTRRNKHNRLYIVWSLFIYNGSHKRGPTSRHVVGTEIQRNRIFEAYFIIFAVVWVVCLVAGLSSHLNFRLTFWYTLLSISSCLVISIASYTKIFRALSHYQAQIHDHTRQQPSQQNALNMVLYRKAVYSALWVQLPLVVCYAPNLTMEPVISLSLNRLSNFIIIVIIICYNGECFSFF